MRAALHDFARDLDRRHVGIVAFVSVAAFGVEACATRLGALLVLLVPICGPLPHVAGHVVEPVAIGRETSYRRSPLKTILLQILPGEFALPGVRHVLAVRCKRISPDKFRTV